MDGKEFILPIERQLHDPIQFTVTYLMMKRLFDIVLSLMGILILSPVFFIIAAIVKLTSPGPVIYRHKRVGCHGQEINIYKFRTMVKDADHFCKYFTPEQLLQYKRNYKLDHDPRDTSFGKYLRWTSLDELPQLFNILKGEMSVVGPRPIVRDELEKYGIYANIYLSVKPGLTGLWQISGRSGTTYEERVQYDVKYVHNISLLNDFVILFKTVGAVLSRRGAC